VLDIEQVVLDPLMEIAFVTIVTAHLPQAGNPGLHRETRFAPRHTHLILAERRRPGTNEAHVTRQYVEELRELVDVQRSKDATDASDSGIPVDFEMWTVRLVIGLEIHLRRMRSDVHRTELPASKDAAVEPLSRVTVEDRAPRFDPIDECGQAQQGRQRDQANRSKDDVEESFENCVCAPSRPI
jgi:hypothetical protein